MADKPYHTVVLFIVTMVMVLQRTGATNYTVGDSFGWNVPSNGVSTYSTWANNHTFRVGDVLVFNFVTGNHDVARVTQLDYSNCNTGSPISVMTTSPVDYMLNATGSYYFICTHDNHCNQGQKLDVMVEASSGTTSAPPPPPPPPPPPRSSASSTSAAYAAASCICVVFLQKLMYARI